MSAEKRNVGWHSLWRLRVVACMALAGSAAMSQCGRPVEVCVTPAVLGQVNKSGGLGALNSLPQLAHDISGLPTFDSNNRKAVECYKLSSCLYCLDRHNACEVFPACVSGGTQVILRLLHELAPGAVAVVR